jgi:putative ABC transport system substrate-binding protein
MNRHEIIAFTGAAALSWPLAARAQQPTMPVIGFLGSRGPSETLSLLGRADEVIE